MTISMKSYYCKDCDWVGEGLSAAANHTQATGPYGTHGTVEQPVLVTGVTIGSVKRDGTIDPKVFGDTSGAIVSLGAIDSSLTEAQVREMISEAAGYALSLDDTVNLVHTICHSVKYAGLVRSATI